MWETLQSFLGRTTPQEIALAAIVFLLIVMFSKAGPLGERVARWLGRDGG